ncbi:MAG: sugar transferase [Acidobacteriota bacterium]
MILPVSILTCPRRRHLWLAQIRYLINRHFPTFKRGFDILVAAALLILLSPLMVAVAIGIKLESPGPVFFRQVRIGELGRPFQLWKFRSMVVDAEARRRALENDESMSGGVRFKIKRDPRITRIGFWLRRLSIDELPQLLNVVLGEMSLVGPRPPIPQEVAAYDLHERRRLDSKPGLTCIWQVSGRSLIPFDEQVLMDIDYSQRQSWTLDLKLLIRTVPAVLRGRGAC